MTSVEIIYDSKGMHLVSINLVRNMNAVNSPLIALLVIGKVGLRFIMK